MIKRTFLFLLISTLFLSGCNQRDNRFCQTQKNTYSTPDPVIQLPTIPPDTLHIHNFGAKGDGQYDNTHILQAAIDSCHLMGGGTIIVAAGTYFSKAIYLKSNVELHLAAGSEILFSNKPADYLPPVFTRWEGIECYNYSPLIYARGCTNIAITGTGKLNGNGKNWWHWAKNGQKETLARLYDMVIAGIPVEERILITSQDTSYLRPSFIQFIDCQKILLQDYTISDGPMWTNHFVYCKDVTAQRLHVETVGTNNDGITPDASENILIDSCFFSTGDDCIVIKSGLNEDGWRVNKASRNIWIRNCHTQYGHGGVVIGSEMSGGVENVYVENCYFNNTDRGIRVKSMKGRGGYVRNIHVKNITMENIKYEAILLNMQYPSSSIAPRGDSLPIFSHIYINNINASGGTDGIKMTGLPEMPIQDIFIQDVYSNAFCGAKFVHANRIHLNRIELHAEHDTAIYFHAADSLCLHTMSIEKANMWASFKKSNKQHIFTKNITHKGVQVKP